MKNIEFRIIPEGSEYEFKIGSFVGLWNSYRTKYQWCKENIENNDWDFQFRGGHSMIPSVIVFHNEEDATAFKLRFGNYD